MSCHIGNAVEGKVVSHAMMAAGHPPLPPIEMATFTRNEPQHWRDPKSVPYLRNNLAKPAVVENYGLKDIDYQRSRSALLGNLVAVRETLRLARDRSDFTAGAKNPDAYYPEFQLNEEFGKDASKRWPELAMAHSDCYACHHDLRYPGFRQKRGFAYHIPGVEMERVVPGRPVVRSWPLAAVKLALKQTGKESELSALKDRLRDLTRATNARPFADPEPLHSAAGALVT